MTATAPQIESTPNAFITFYLGKQMFALPLDGVRDVIKTSAPLIPIPHAPRMVKGMMACREHVAISIDLRARLGLPPASATTRAMMLIVEHETEWYSLLVDRIDDVAHHEVQGKGGAPIASDPLWNQVISGIIKKGSKMIVVLDIAGIIEGAAAH